MTATIAFTREYAYQLDSWPNVSPTFVSIYKRQEHARVRLFEGPRSFQQIAWTCGLDTGPLNKAWSRYQVLYRFAVLGGEHEEISERWQRLVIAALRALEELKQFIPVLGIHAKDRLAKDRHGDIDLKILDILRRKPEGAVDAIAAYMVLMATSVEEQDEAYKRRLLAEPEEPKLIRDLGAEGVLWALPVRRSETLRDVEFVTIRIVSRAGGSTLATHDIVSVTVAGGSRGGEELGPWSWSRYRRGEELVALCEMGPQPSLLVSCDG